MHLKRKLCRGASDLLSEKNSNNQDHTGYELAVDLTSITRDLLIMGSPLEVNIRGKCWDVDT